MESVVSGVNQYLNLSVYTLHISALGQGMRYSNVNFSFLPSPHFLHRQPSPTDLPHHWLMLLQNISTFTNLVLYHLWLGGIILKPKMHFFLHSGHLNWYMQHHYLVQRKPLPSGVPSNKSLFKFEYIFGVDTAKILILRQMKK